MTGTGASARLFPHTVSNNTTHYINMKKTLLVAMAALALGTISSQAQGAVYSQNIVGYVNTVLPGGGAYSQIVNPLNGATNTVEGLVTTLDSGDVVYMWDATNNVYYSATYYGGPDGFLTPPNDWYDQYNNYTNSPTVAPGQGFVISTQSGTQQTNTFTGTVLVSNSIPLLGNGAYSLIGSTAPIGGSLGSTNFNLPLDSGDVIYVWDSAANAYYSSTYYGGPDGFLSYPNDWYDQYNNYTNAPVINIGQAFFYSTQSGNNSEVWKQNMTLPQ